MDDDRSSTVWNLPNTLTAIRICLIPVFATLLLYHYYPWAFFIYAAAAVTDLLDGYLARTGNLQTKLGGILDPVADKFLLSTSFILFAFLEWVPLWLTVTVISRDIVVVTGALLVRLISKELVVRPTFLGKTAVAGQMVLIGYVLASRTFAGGMFPGVFGASLAIAVLTVVSGFQYILQGLQVDEGA